MKIKIIIVWALLCGVLVSPPLMHMAQAATWTVNSLDDSSDGACNATNCTLREAITAANAAPDADVISFSLSGAGPHHIMLLSALPDVQSDLAIKGFSDPAMLIIQRAADSAEFRLLTIGDQRTVSIEGLTLSGGKAEAGGAVHNSGALTMRRCIVKNNQASYGGGLQHWMGTILLEECSFFDNTADNNGGGASLFAPFTLRFCTFNNNEAAQYGGGLSVSSAAGAVRVCTISGNRARRRGGGIFSQNGTTNYLNLRNSTIAYNEAFDGGGLCFLYNGITTLSTIFAYNSGGDVKHASDAQPTTILSWGSNLTSDSAPALERPFGAPHDLQNTDPLLLPLANNGGRTATHAFRPDSPAKEKGWRVQERDGTLAETTDQRGVTRPIDDPNIPNAIAHQGDSPYTPTIIYGDGTDIGAYELSPTTISIRDITMNERDSSTTQALFQVALSQRFPVDVTVQYITVNGSAVEGSDYHATSGVLTIPAGNISASISVPVVGDVLDEENEYFGINLSQAINATITDPQGIGTIVDNDTTPLIINDANVVEGNNTTEAEFTVSLSAPNPQTVTVQCRTADGIAKASSDYEALAPITLTFAPGEVNKTFSVPITGDLLDEANENFFVILSAPVNATIGRGRGIGTITDDDATPGITVDDVSIGEGPAQGAPGGQRVAAFRLKLSAPSGQAVRVNVATDGGTATAGNDYVALSSMPIAFNVGSQYAYARVLINGDVLNEKDETFFVNLSSPLNAAIVDNQALGTIVNDDRAPSLTINDAQIAEGNNGTRELTFTVTLSAASGQIVSVNYTTANGIARSTSDYATTSGTLNFAPGILTQTITVAINGDILMEGDETLYVLLSNAVNASIGRGRGMGIILNDDSSG